MLYNSEMQAFIIVPSLPPPPHRPKDFGVKMHGQLALKVELGEVERAESLNVLV